MRHDSRSSVMIRVLCRLMFISIIGITVPGAAQELPRPITRLPVSRGPVTSQPLGGKPGQSRRAKTTRPVQGRAFSPVNVRTRDPYFYGLEEQASPKSYDSGAFVGPYGLDWQGSPATIKSIGDYPPESVYFGTEYKGRNPQYPIKERP